MEDDLKRTLAAIKPLAKLLPCESGQSVARRLSQVLGHGNLCHTTVDRVKASQWIKKLVSDESSRYLLKILQQCLVYVTTYTYTSLDVLVATMQVFCSLHYGVVILTIPSLPHLQLVHYLFPPIMADIMTAW